jgi:glucose/arabinose dehydrogenase
MELCGGMRGVFQPVVRRSAVAATAVLLTWSIAHLMVTPATAQSGPVVFDRNLSVRTVVAQLEQPVSIAFLGPDNFLLTEKASGRVKHVVNGAVSATLPLDLAVNNNSERGLLGIALHPDFASTHWVYLYWTCRTAAAPTPDTPQLDCPPVPQTGADSGNALETALLGNRVDRFVWDGSTLTFDRNIIKLHAFQFDATNGVARGNHNGGVIRFGPDGKLYIIIGDNGRRGQLQNLVNGPFGAGIPDDQFGGPAPDNAHYTGVIIRLNDDGSTPSDNPFAGVTTAANAEALANIHRTFAYGVRNSFGMAFDPVSGDLWDEQNGDDTFDEVNRVEPGSNLGWVQVMGPIDRVAEFKQIETTLGTRDLQQLRYPPTRIADTPAEALSRLFMLPGAHYSDPEFSWKFAVAPAAIGFLEGAGLGPQYAGDLFVGASRPTLDAGYLFHFNLTGNRRNVGVDDPRLEDRVADNIAKFDPTESETIRFGTGFGVGTDIQTSPAGTLYVVSLSNGAVYEIFRNR